MSRWDDGHLHAWIEGVRGPLSSIPWCRGSCGTFAGFAASNRRESLRRPGHGTRGERGLGEDGAQTGKSADGRRCGRTGCGLLGGSDHGCGGDRAGRDPGDGHRV
jgi:hypothetical protein